MADGDDVLWGRSFITHDLNSSIYTNGGEIDAEIGYGFNLWDGASVFTPYGGVALTDNEDDEVSLGSKLNIGLDIQFELRALAPNRGMERLKVKSIWNRTSNGKGRGEYAPLKI